MACFLSSCQTLTLGRIAVVHTLAAAVDRLLDVAAVHVQHLQAEDQLVGLATGAGIDIVVEDTAMHIDHDARVLQRVVIGVGLGHIGVGDTVVHDAGRTLIHGIKDMLAEVVGLHAPGGSHQAAAEEV